MCSFGVLLTFVQKKKEFDEEQCKSSWPSLTQAAWQTAPKEKFASSEVFARIAIIKRRRPTLLSASREGKGAPNTEPHPG